MSDNAEELSTQELFPEQDAPVAEPDKAPETPAPEPKETPKETPSPAPSDKGQQQEQQTHWIPKWRLDEVLEQNRQLKAQVPQQPNPQQPQARQPAPQAPVQPNEADYPNWEEFRKAEREYFRAEAAFQAEQVIQRHQQQSTQAQQYQALQQRVEKADTDWNADLYAATQKNPALIQKLQNAPALRPDLQLVLKESKARVALAEHLADNPAMVLQINQMPPDQAIWAMSEAAFKLTAATGGPQKKPSAQAPDLDPVGGGNRTTKKNPYSPDASVEDFIFGTARLPSKS